MKRPKPNQRGYHPGSVEDRNAPYVFLLVSLLLVHHPVGQELVALSVVVIVHLSGELAAEGRKPQSAS